MNARCRLLFAVPMLAFGLLSSSGCKTPSALALERKVAELQERIAEQDNQLIAQQITIKEQREKLQRIKGLTDEDLERIFSPEKIVIASLSGGDDYDGRPGDDGITVYLRPIDRDGDAVKVAGNIRIELYDLANPPGENLIGKYAIPVDEVSKLWYGKLATYHYTIRCPWLSGPPKHDEITIRAVFEDYLTGRVMTAQTLRKVRLAR